MTLKRKILLGGVVMAAAIASQPAAAQYYYAQPYGQHYAYPYVVVQQQPYAPVARSYPYVIHRPQAYAPQSYPQPRRAYVSQSRRSKVRKAKLDGHARTEQAAQSRQIHREVTRADPALIEELRRKTGKKIDKTIIVRGKPRVIERTRYVDDPPVVINRHKVVDVTVPAAAPHRARGGADHGEPRVIHAEAEVTILGPDRMNIRLYRKGLGANAKADAKVD